MYIILYEFLILINFNIYSFTRVQRIMQHENLRKNFFILIFMFFIMKKRISRKVYQPGLEPGFSAQRTNILPTEHPGLADQPLFTLMNFL